MAHLVIGHGFPLLGIEYSVLLLQARHDALDGGGEILQLHGGRFAPGRGQRGLVDQVREVCTRKARGQRSHLFEIDILSQRHLLDVDFQDVQPSLLVGPVHQHLAVEAAGAQQRLVEDFGAVGGGEDDQPHRAVEAVHLGEQLVERLLTLVVAADGPADAACTAQRVEFIDEDDGRRLPARLLEQVAHPRRAHADKHLDELRAGDREERYPGLARHGLGQQGLARAGRANQQHTFRDARAEAAVILRVLQEVDDFDQLGLGLIDTRDIGKGDAGVLLHEHLGAALADAQEAAHALLLGEAAEQEEPDAEEGHRRQNPGEHIT